MGHALIENRHGLVVQADATQATGKAERQAALAMIDRAETPAKTDQAAAARECTPPHLAVAAKSLCNQAVAWASESMSSSCPSV